MGELTDNRYTKYRDGLITALPVKGGTHIFKGGFVCWDADGYAVPGANKAGYIFAGIALEEIDNTDGVAGAQSIRVQTNGVFSLAKDGPIAQADCGGKLYIVNAQTVALATSESIHCGQLEGLDGPSDVWVRIRRA